MTVKTLPQLCRAQLLVMKELTCAQLWKLMKPCIQIQPESNSAYHVNISYSKICLVEASMGADGSREWIERDKHVVQCVRFRLRHFNSTTCVPVSIRRFRYKSSINESSVITSLEIESAVTKATVLASDALHRNIWWWFTAHLSF